MRAAVISVWAVIATIFFVQTANGLQTSLLSFRAALEFPAATIGIIMASYYVGYSLAPLVSRAVIGRAGHVNAMWIGTVGAALAIAAPCRAGDAADLVAAASRLRLRAVERLCRRRELDPRPRLQREARPRLQHLHGGADDRDDHRAAPVRAGRSQEPDTVPRRRRHLRPRRRPGSARARHRAAPPAARAVQYRQAVPRLAAGRDRHRAGRGVVVDRLHLRAGLCAAKRLRRGAGQPVHGARHGRGRLAAISLRLALRSFRPPSDHRADVRRRRGRVAVRGLGRRSRRARHLRRLGTRRRADLSHVCDLRGARQRRDRAAEPRCRCGRIGPAVRSGLDLRAARGRRARSPAWAPAASTSCWRRP